MSSANWERKFVEGQSCRHFIGHRCGELSGWDGAWVSSITNPSQAAGFFTGPNVTSLAIRGLLGWSEQAFLFSCIQLGDYCQIYQQ